ncbi:hypothetical protein F441_14086 [Phytophthora nicotianae CJ01A1]|uniref:Uncharacterized protein n=5 Tax=Phytophthora nicotianae TaxID=4792 RepID=W2PV35_PHYN3|nr:hypothetical protein PPTG_23549 [Phytophthora nicotianae INRA-310]ETI40414.1 hypothetical protein F443_14186 [Phytophthora nicotianae P1569]ETL33942.1 hypothetical protein L916_13726 [Phytophthora nicotianae]ETO69119.1 hypothetical protein F444_14207 [Phytophthora nicotianae P1976]ETP10236.1 hypothetical protein F441_14086 [Phytophthora nicotianae CJ01A1]ETL87216.1 hypothetical protein L917_13532 [Phytophthora nicotianae]
MDLPRLERFGVPGLLGGSLRGARTGSVAARSLVELLPSSPPAHDRNRSNARVREGRWLPELGARAFVLACGLSVARACRLRRQVKQHDEDVAIAETGIDKRSEGGAKGGKADRVAPYTLGSNEAREAEAQGGDTK